MALLLHASLVLWIYDDLRDLGFLRASISTFALNGPNLRCKPKVFSGFQELGPQGLS